MTRTIETLPRLGRTALAAGVIVFAAAARATPTAPPTHVPIVAIVISDDDGSRTATTSPDNVRTWLEFANRVFAPAGIAFDFAGDASDFLTLRDSVINRLVGDVQADWHAAQRHSIAIASRHPTQVVLFFRYGPDPLPTGASFGGFDNNFVTMCGWQAGNHCGHPHTDALAHEIGHYLGLSHTFPQPFESADAALKFLREHGNRPAAFDGDGLADTPPDPCVRYTECERVSTLTLGTLTLPLSRRNIMSYYDERDALSPQQIARVRWYLAFRRAHGMRLPTNDTAAAAQEVESLPRRDVRRCTPIVQPMGGFGCRSWSGGAQLYCKAEHGGGLTVSFRAPTAGRARIDLYATLAPDYGRMTLTLDRRRLPHEIDGYGPAVHETGPIALGEFALAAGEHSLQVDVRSKNPRASGFAFGLDCIDVVPVGARGAP
ncbi:MAG: M43 family zinc metalloprotease [Phycisphaerae bacterium]